MPAKSKKQQRFAAMSASPAGRKALKKSGKVPMSISAAKDYRSYPLKGLKRKRKS